MNVRLVLPQRAHRGPTFYRRLRALSLRSERGHNVDLPYTGVLH